MEIKEKFEKFRDSLREGDVRVCGESPIWIRQELLLRVDALLGRESNSATQDDVEVFAIGAIRFVADQCGSECDLLVQSMSELTKQGSD